MAERGVALIADDDPANLRFLAQLLRDHGYSVRAAKDGQAAVNSARMDPPDVALLDIHMPGLDGYQACEVFKSDENLKDIPVLFLSGLAESFNRRRAFEVGAVDYITKPYESLDILSRVDVHYRLRKLQVELQRRNDELARQRQLQDELFAMIAHDMRSPLTTIYANLDLIDEPTGAKGMRLSVVSDMREGIHRLVDLTDDLIALHRLEGDSATIDLVQPYQLSTLVEETVARFPQDQRDRIDLAVPTALTVNWDKSMVKRVLSNLVLNAFRHGPAVGRVLVDAELVGGSVRLRVRDSGPGVSEELQERIFDKFYTTRGRNGGSGLGLAFCRLVAEAHAGTIRAEILTDESAMKSAFVVECPQLVS